ncbi:hypothetical protein HanPI659440_Chr05g0185671 [Helianthus annuus]|nr:hypothetical protein HanPI659440_Chr05g0185671 [Helianthus annuus]
MFSIFSGNIVNLYEFQAWKFMLNKHEKIKMIIEMSRSLFGDKVCRPCFSKL